MKKLEGKVAVITGGSTGIGLATAKRFTSEGAHVYITGRRQSELDEAVTEIGDNAIGVQGDVSNLADLDRLYATVKEQKDQIDILFANAGIAESAPLGAITEAHFDKIFRRQRQRAFLHRSKSVTTIQAGDGGSICLTASVGGSKGRPGD